VKAKVEKEMQITITEPKRVLSSAMALWKSSGRILTLVSSVPDLGGKRGAETV